MNDTPQAADTDSQQSDDPNDVSRLAGRVIDERYRLETYLGGGGMGEVYRAEHTLMHKTVAVKLLKPEVAEDESIIERFRREAAAAANLDHPNICAATDFGKTEDGYFYLVMEYVDGRSLQEVADERGALPVDEAATIADGIAAALEKANELDVVHRDVKPDNVMLVDRGGAGPEVKVLDFGVAHVEFNDQMPSLTKTGAVFGTPTYMSPEQATGDEVEHRSDLYGLGAVLFEMLTGREVFDEKESAKLMAAHITEPPPRVAQIRGEDQIPPDLDDLVAELLAKKPEDRPESATAVRARLAPYRSQQADSTAPPSPAPSTTQDRSRPPSTSILRQTTQKIRKWARTSGLDGLAGGGLNLALLGVAGFLGLVFFGLFAVSIYLLASSSPDEIRASLEEQRSTYAQKSAVAEAVEPLENGRPAAAVERLEALQEKRGDSAPAHLHFLLGRSYDKIGNELETIAAFRRAAEVDSDYLYADEVQSALVDSIGAGHSDLYEAGRAFAEQFPDHPAVLRRIGTLAWRPDSDRTRERAREILEENDMIDDLEEWQRLSIELREADDCEGYQKYISKIVELEDPRAVEILKIYEEKPHRGCGLLNTRDCYDCIRDQLDEAIDSLES